MVPEAPRQDPESGPSPRLLGALAAAVFTVGVMNVALVALAASDTALRAGLQAEGPRMGAAPLAFVLSVIAVLVLARPKRA
jgi:hypothetical protein